MGVCHVREGDGGHDGDGDVPPELWVLIIPNGGEAGAGVLGLHGLDFGDVLCQKRGVFGQIDEVLHEVLPVEVVGREAVEYVVGVGDERVVVDVPVIFLEELVELGLVQLLDVEQALLALLDEGHRESHAEGLRVDRESDADGQRGVY